jgi:hypothetical protein
MASGSEQKKRVLVQGWRFIPHSYAIVNQWQLLAFLKRGDVDLKVRDTPYPYAQWKSGRGVFRRDQEEALANIPDGNPAAAHDVLLRIGFPYDLTPSASRRTAVFITSEFCAIPSSHFAGRPDFAALLKRDDLFVLPPSNWAAEAAYVRGFRKEQVLVTPHGVDPETFKPMPERRADMRRQLGLDGFVFMSVGAMTENKGTEVLLKAFAEVVQKRPDSRLLLKGLDPLHNSRERLQREFAALPFPVRRLLQEKVHYIGEQWSMDAMALLFQAADVYVSPYHAEGFNIPVLEAAACGLPLIVTGGGATDDFVTDDFARKIKAHWEPARFEDVLGKQLFPDLDHLIDLMQSAMDDESWRRSASSAGPRYAHENFNWDSIVDRMLMRLG